MVVDELRKNGQKDQVKNHYCCFDRKLRNSHQSYDVKKAVLQDFAKFRGK